MSESNDDLSAQLAQLQITHNDELNALHAKHHRERAALLASSSSSSTPVSAVVVAPPVAVLVAPTPSPSLPAFDSLDQPLSVGAAVLVLNNGRNSPKGSIATIVRISTRKDNWVCIRISETDIITWRAGFNLEYL